MVILWNGGKHCTSLFSGFNICSYCCLYKWTAIVVREIIVKSDVFATWGWPLYLLCLPSVATRYKSLIVVNGGIFINRQRDVFFMHLRNVAAQKMWSHFTRFVFFSISPLWSGTFWSTLKKNYNGIPPMCAWWSLHLLFGGSATCNTKKS